MNCNSLYTGLVILDQAKLIHSLSSGIFENHMQAEIQAYLIQKSLASYLTSSLYILWDFAETSESLLAILDDSKGFTIIPFVPHTMIIAVKLPEHELSLGIDYLVRNNELWKFCSVSKNACGQGR